MLKWFGFESGESEGGKSATDVKNEEIQSKPSVEDNSSGSEKCISEDDKDRQVKAALDDETTKSNSTPSMSGAFGKHNIDFELKIDPASRFLASRLFASRFVESIPVILLLNNWKGLYISYHESLNLL